MKQIKLFLCGLMHMGIVLGMGLCTSSVPTDTDEIMQYLEQKYPDDQFTFVDYVSVDEDLPGTVHYDIVKVSSANYPDYEIEVERVERNGVVYFESNYLNVRYAEDIEEIAGEIMEESLGGDVEYVLQYYSYYEDYADTMGSDSSLEAFLAADDVHITIDCAVKLPEEELDRQIFEARYRKAVSDRQINIWGFHVYFTEDSAAFDADKKSGEVSEVIDSHYSYFDVFMSAVDTYRRIEWD